MTQQAIEYYVQGMEVGQFLQHLASIEQHTAPVVPFFESSMDLHERADGKRLRALLKQLSATLDVLLAIDADVQRGYYQPAMGAFLIERNYDPIKPVVLEIGRMFQRFKEASAVRRAS